MYVVRPNLPALMRLAEQGDKTEVGPYEATVVDVSRHRVQRLRLTLRNGNLGREREDTEPT